jgi:hypothetical protein
VPAEVCLQRSRVPVLHCLAPPGRSAALAHVVASDTAAGWVSPDTYSRVGTTKKASSWGWIVARRRMRRACGTGSPLSQFFVRVEEPVSIDARPSVPDPSYRLRPRLGALVCVSCTRLIAPGARLPDCLIASCPRELIPAPTNPVAWRAFVETADQD